MVRERALKAVLLLAGLLSVAGIYPISTTLWRREQSGYADAMMLSLYFALGIFLLMAVRNPPAHRSLIAYAGWANLAHAAVMAIMAFRDASQRELLPGVALFAAMGLLLIILVPRKRLAEHASATSA